MSQALQEQVMQPVQLPNPYLAMAVRSFHAALEQYHRWGWGLGAWGWVVGGGTGRRVWHDEHGRTLTHHAHAP